MFLLGLYVWLFRSALFNLRCLRDWSKNGHLKICTIYYLQERRNLEIEFGGAIWNISNIPELRGSWYYLSTILYYMFGKYLSHLGGLIQFFQTDWKLHDTELVVYFVYCSNICCLTCLGSNSLMLILTSTKWDGWTLFWIVI